MHVAGEEDKRANGSDSALKRSRKEVKQLEESLRQQSDELEKARKEIGRLTRENEKLKKELSARRSPPKWAKPNKEDKQGKKKGPKFGHKRRRSTRRWWFFQRAARAAAVSYLSLPLLSGIPTYKWTYPRLGKCRSRNLL
jgi:septal ring factor EnvC (AmiA/AmiB activator)